MLSKEWHEEIAEKLWQREELTKEINRLLQTAKLPKRGRTAVGMLPIDGESNLRRQLERQFALAYGSDNPYYPGKKVAVEIKATTKGGGEEE